MRRRIKEGERVITHTDEERKALGFDTTFGGVKLYATRSLLYAYGTHAGGCICIDYADFMAREAEAKETPKVKNLAELINEGECVHLVMLEHAVEIAQHAGFNLTDIYAAMRDYYGIYVERLIGGALIWRSGIGDDRIEGITVSHSEWMYRVKASDFNEAAKPVIEVDFSEVETEAKLHEKGKKLLTESRKALNVPKEQSYNITSAPTENFLLASLRADVNRMLEIAEAKNHDYGGKDSNPFANFMAVEHLGAVSAETGITVRMTDKLSRIVTLLNKDAKVSDESITDTLLDLANYALILKALIAYKKQPCGPAIY